MNSTSYIIPPPTNLPFFLFKRRGSNLHNLIEWAKQEHYARLRFCAEHGYWKELKRLNEDYSPIRVLSEVRTLRKICANITVEAWNELTRKEREFVTSAYEMWTLLR